MAKAKKERLAILRINADVVREIRLHARSSNKTEVCGVLLGKDADGVTAVSACVSGVNAAQGGTHVTFTQDTWEHIFKIKDRDYPNDRIVGWYHSHPGFGVFLSDHDTFIHKNFFSSPSQVAWVYDPHSDEEGCFGWNGARIERLAQFAVVDHKGGEIAGASGKPEPSAIATGEIDDWAPSESRRNDRAEDPELSRLARVVSTVFSHLAIFLLGGLLVWYLLPRILVMPIPVDPNTGKPLHSLQDSPPERAAPQDPLKNQHDSGNPAGHTDHPNQPDAQRGNVQ